MKNYTITVNGQSYDVSVEEKGGSSSASAAAAPSPAPAKKPAVPSGAGSVKIEAGAAGKVFSIKASVGASLKKGDTVMVLEVMKMETPVVAPVDGTLASIDVTEGAQVESGALLATMNE